MSNGERPEVVHQFENLYRRGFAHTGLPFPECFEVLRDLWEHKASRFIGSCGLGWLRLG